MILNNEQAEQIAAEVYARHTVASTDDAFSLDWEMVRAGAAHADQQWLQAIGWGSPLGQKEAALRIKTEEHDCCTEDLIQLRSTANELLHQIDINDFVDSHGHALKNFKAVHDLLRLLAA